MARARANNQRTERQREDKRVHKQSKEFERKFSSVIKKLIDLERKSGVQIGLLALSRNRKNVSYYFCGTVNGLPTFQDLV